MMHYLIKPIIKHYYLTTIVILAITLFLAYNLKNLRFDNDVAAMLPDDHPTKIAQNEMKEDFGTAEMIMIGFETDDIFNADLLEKIKNLSKKLKKLKVESNPFVDQETGEIRTKQKRCIADVISLSTMNHIEGSEYGMKVSTLMKNVPRNKEEMMLLKEKVFSWDFYVGNIVSSDSTATCIAIEYKSNLTPEELVRMSDAIQNAVAEAQFGKDIKVYIAGEPFVAAVITKGMTKDLGLMIPLVFVVVIVFLIITLRKISNVVLIVVTIATSVLWTVGLMAAFNFSFNFMTSAIPVLLVAIGSAYSIHIVNHYSTERAEGKEPAEAAQNSITIVGISVLGAALTTMAGFMSLMVSKIIPIREFGLFSGLGTGVAFVVSVIFVPALLLSFDSISSKIPKKRKNKGKGGIDAVPFYLYLSKRLTKDSKIVFSLTILIIAASVYFSLQMQPDLNIIKFFKKKSEIRQANTFLCEKFGGTTTMVLSLESDYDNYFKNPEALQKLDDLRTHMLDDPFVGMVVSIADPIKRMNYAMNGNKKEFDSVPATKQHVSQYLLLNSDPEALEGMVTSDYAKARILILIKDGSSDTVKMVNKRLNDWLSNNISSLRISIAGTSQVIIDMNELIVKGQIQSLIFSIIMVLIISSMILRSFVGGLLAITPLSVSVILNFGIFGFMGLPLDVSTAIFSAIAIGISVDYSIHLLNGIKHGLKTKGAEFAVDEGIKITGNAITFNALSVAFGFIVLTFSSFTNWIKMGSIIGFTMVTACAGTLLLLPVLVNKFRLERFIASKNSVLPELREVKN